MVFEQVSRLFWWSSLRRWQVALSSWGWHASEPGAGSRAPCTGDPGPARQAMLALLVSLPVGAAPRLGHAIRAGADLAALWQLRGALMQAVAIQHGEARALGELARIDTHFLAAWPDAPVSRPAGLD